MNWLIIAVGIAANASASVLVKIAMARPDFFVAPSAPWRLLANLPLVLGVACYGVAFILYAVALARMPLSVVHPILTVGAIACVAVLSFALFNEPFPPLKLAGVGLVIAGVVLIASSTT